MQGQARQEMLVALCLMTGGEKGGALFQFAASSEQSDLERLSRRLQKGDPRALKMRIRNLSRFGRRLAFEEIHPGWILESLRGESPRLLGLLSKFLSEPKADFILKHLNAEERRTFPKPVRPIAPELLETLRILLENKFGGVSLLKTDESFCFQHLGCLKREDLRELLQDVGMEEVRKAFTGLEPRVLRAFMSRFAAADAAEIRRRLSQGKAVTPEAKRAAQKNLLSLRLENGPERFFLEIGFAVWVRALDLTDLDWAESCCQKFSVAEGYHLKRLLQEKQARREAGNGELREEIMARLFVLATQGKIRRYWKEEKEIEPTVIFQAGGR